jgi:hypothetical protein
MEYIMDMLEFAKTVLHKNKDFFSEKSDSGSSFISKVSKELEKYNFNEDVYERYFFNLGFHAQSLSSMCIMTLNKHMHQAMNYQNDSFDHGIKQVRSFSHETRGISHNASKVLEPFKKTHVNCNCGNPNCSRSYQKFESHNKREGRLDFPSQTICFSVDHKNIIGESAAHYINSTSEANYCNHSYKSIDFLCGEYSKVFNLNEKYSSQLNKNYNDKFQNIIKQAYSSVRYTHTLMVLFDVDHINSFPSDAYRTVNSSKNFSRASRFITDKNKRKEAFFHPKKNKDISFQFWNLNIPNGGKWAAIQVYRDKKDAQKKKKIKIKIDYLISEYLWDCFANSNISCDQTRSTLFNSILSFSNKQKYNEIYGCYTANKFDFNLLSVNNLIKLYDKTNDINEFGDLEKSFKESLFFKTLKTHSQIDNLRKIILFETKNYSDQSKLVQTLDDFLNVKNKQGISGISLASESQRKVILEAIMSVNDDKIKNQLIKKMIISRFSGCSKNFFFSSKSNNLDGYSNIPRGIHKAMTDSELTSDNKNDIPRILESLKNYNKNNWLVLSVSSNYKVNAVFNMVFLFPLVALKSISNCISRKGSTSTFYKNISQISKEDINSFDCLSLVPILSH